MGFKHVNSLFNSGPETGAGDNVRSGGPTVEDASRADEDGMLFSAVRRASESNGTSPGGADKEITLGTMTVLGLFFALAVLCAGFFGFGYSSGLKHSVRSPGAAVASADGSTLPGCKPAPGSPVGSAAALTASTVPVNVPYTPPGAIPTPRPAVGNSTSETANSTPVEHASARNSSVAAAAVPGATTSSAAEPQAQTLVQVAALSHQADADLVASTLKGRGYDVAIHTSPSDKLLHVQLGPFASRKEADAMRQRLLSDGFNAILK